MQQFKRSRRTVPLSALFLRVALIAVGIVVVFFIIRLIVRGAGTPAIRADELRKEFSSKRSLVAKIAELENTIATYHEAIQETELLREENESLKAELGRHAAAAGILARVLTPPNRSFYDTVIIDAGSDEGIAEGQIAYAFESIAIGTVASVQPREATVQLFSAPGRETAGTAEGNDTGITLIGRGAGEYEVRMPRDIPFAVGETVSMQSVHAAVLARIEHIATDPRDPFQRLLAKAPVNLNALKFVIVK